MNHAVARTNSKGQFVIPVLMRKDWGIDSNTSLLITNVPDVGIVIKPATATPITDEEYMQILEETKGAWAGDDWPETEARYNKIEEQAAKELKSNSW
jgi:bifunctional DNA-binding transcriptional regulator/antitoxin component of YhaV-PrlF toxin-antitoxin module